MKAGPRLFQDCPSCRIPLRVQQVHCEHCGLSMEGRFELPRLARLSEEHQEFVEAFVLAGGSITEMEKRLGVSYPTIRRRLDEVMEALKKAERPRGHEVLDLIESGKLSAKEGAALLRRLGPKKEKP